MYLYTDEQTIEDLRIFSGKNGNGIFDIYNAVHTRGGEEMLRDMFRNPLSDTSSINLRSQIIKQMAKADIKFPFSATVFDAAEKYLHSSIEQGKDQSHQTAVLSEKEMSNGVLAVIEILWTLRDFAEHFDIVKISEYNVERKKIISSLKDAAFEPVMLQRPQNKLPYSALAAFDLLFRVRLFDEMMALFKQIYLLDVYLTVAQVAVQRSFIFPEALEKNSGELFIENVYHPELKNPVGNKVYMGKDKNMIFLTGANMAGKSTFLRSVSTALFLAHMGFPVAAAAMRFTVMDGLFTTINLPDKLGIGASHFYVEVLRVRKVATELGQGKSLFVIFDELFRGTNVKDAHEATVAVSEAFAKKRTSMFIISSHIVEAADELKKIDHLDFQYLPTRMNGVIPEYTYQLNKGVTDDRHGMLIINNEGILEILKNGIKN